VVTKSIVAISSSPTKRVFAEEATGTWCGFCVRGIVHMDSMTVKYPDTWIGVAVHGSDPMENTPYSSGLNASGFPSALIDRATGFVDPMDFEFYYQSRISKQTPVEVSLSNISYNSTSRLISFDVNTIPAASISADWRFNGVIYENDVTWDSPADSADYQQHNYYSGGSIGPMGGFENLPGIIPASYMHYDHVARAILGGYNGTAGSIPSSVTDGSTYSHTYTYTLPASMDASQIHVVGFVIDHSNGEVLNADQSLLLPAGIDEYSGNDLNVYPDPTTGMVYLSDQKFERVEVYDLLGQLMLSKNNTDKIDISAFADGVYLVKAGNRQNIRTSKVILRK
jgi:hypothetical protein